MKRLRTYCIDVFLLWMHLAAVIELNSCSRDVLIGGGCSQSYIHAIYICCSTVLIYLAGFHFARLHPMQTPIFDMLRSPTREHLNGFSARVGRNPRFPVGNRLVSCWAVSMHRFVKPRKNSRMWGRKKDLKSRWVTLFCSNSLGERPRGSRMVSRWHIPPPLC